MNSVSHFRFALAPVPRSASLRRPLPIVLLALALAVLLAGCGVPAPDRDASPQAALAWPELPATGVDRVELRVQRDASGAWFEVDPAGPLARLGHSHVIGGAIVEGRVLLGSSPESSAVDLSLDPAAVEVDRPDWRAEAGMDPELDPEAITGTRRNLLGPGVLDVERHPLIELRSTGLERDDDAWRIEARIRFQQRIISFSAPLQLVLEDDRLISLGQLRTRSRDAGTGAVQRRRRRAACRRDNPDPVPDRRGR